MPLKGHQTLAWVDLGGSQADLADCGEVAVRYWLISLCICAKTCHFGLK
jgi:hypothetical protein